MLVLCAVQPQRLHNATIALVLTHIYNKDIFPPIAWADQRCHLGFILDKAGQLAWLGLGLQDTENSV